jgi:hypothetical protein
MAARQFRIKCPGLLQQYVVRPQVDDGVAIGVELVDAQQVGLHHFVARQLAAVDGL